MTSSTANFLTSSGLWSCALGGCAGAATERVNSQVYSQYQGLFLDGTAAYWIDATQYAVMKCGAGGCGGKPVTMVDQVNAQSLAVDGQNLYWSDASEKTVSKRPK